MGSQVLSFKFDMDACMATLLGGEAWTYVESWVEQKANLRPIHMGSKSQVPTCTGWSLSSFYK